MAKKDEKQTPQVPSTSDTGDEPTGDTPQAVSPTPGDKDQPTPAEPTVDDKDKDDKTVPLKALEEERRKRKEAEEKLKGIEEQPKPPAFNWETLLNPQPTEESQQPVPAEHQPAAPPGDPFAPYNQWLQNEMEEGRGMQAVLGIMQMYDANKRQQETQARQFVGDERFRDLDINSVSDQEVMAFSQNPIAMRATIAALKAGKPLPKTPPPAGPATAQTLQDQEAEIEKRVRKQVMEEMTKASGTTAESPSGPPSPTEPVYELDEAAERYLNLRGITDPEQRKAFAKRLASEIEKP